MLLCDWRNQCCRAGHLWGMTAYKAIAGYLALDGVKTGSAIVIP